MEEPTTEMPEEDSPELGGMQSPDTPLEVFNLVPELLKTEQEWLEKEAKRVITKYKADVESRKDFMERRANQAKLYAGIVDPLKFPAEGAKAPHLPVVLRAMLRLWARIWDQVCPAKGDIVHIAATGSEDEERGRRIEKHMNWQLRTKMPDWVSSHGDSIMQWLLSGSMFRHYYWDPVAHCNRVDYLPIDDIVIAYSEKDVHPLMPKVPRISRVRRMPRHEIEQWADEGYYANLDSIYPKEDEGSTSAANINVEEEDSVVRDVNREVEGIDKPDTIRTGDDKDPDAPRILIEQHMWLRIPGFEKIKPVIFTVDKATQKPLGLTIREAEDPLDKVRFDSEMQEFQQAMMSPPVPGPDGMVPSPPGEPAPVRMKTQLSIVHYRLFPNPDGFYGLGAGYLLENANELVNELVSDTLIAGKFASIPMGFISDRAKQKRGEIQMVPGKFHALPLQPEEMQHGIKQFSFSPPPPVLMEMARWLNDEADGQSSSPDLLSGEKGASNETAKSMQIRSSMALTLISVMSRLYIEPMKYEVKLIAHGNSVFLTDREFFWVTEPSKKLPGKNESVKVEISRADYLEDYDITFTADARMSSKPERISDAMGLIDRIINSPLVQDPQRGPALLDLGFRELFRAMEKPEFEAAMGDPPQPPPPPVPWSQMDENAGFVNEQDHPVMPDDDHNEHIMDIQEFRESAYFQAMSSTGKQLLDRHERGHVAELYKAAKGAINGAAQAGMGPVTGGAEGLPPGPGDGAVPEMVPDFVGPAAGPPGMGGG